MGTTTCGRNVLSKECSDWFLLNIAHVAQSSTNVCLRKAPKRGSLGESRSWTIWSKKSGKITWPGDLAPLFCQMVQRLDFEKSNSLSSLKDDHIPCFYPDLKEPYSDIAKGIPIWFKWTHNTWVQSSETNKPTKENLPALQIALILIWYTSSIFLSLFLKVFKLLRDFTLVNQPMYICHI